jgi:Ca-activated chloride channel family protein
MSPSLKNNAFKCKLSLVSMAIIFAFGCAGPDSKSEHELADTKTNQTELHRQIHSEPKQVEQSSQQAILHLSTTDAAPEHLALSSPKMTSESYHANAKALGRIQQVHSNFIASIPNSEKYQSINESSVKLVSQAPVSTFSVDVDTGSYSNVRRMLNQGTLPPADAVRVEEFLNYFDYQYETPETMEQPFSVNTAIAQSPWNSERHIMRIGLQGYQMDDSQSAGNNLVFLLDVSGSMNQANKLPLLKRSLTMLTQQLDSEDSVSIVVYAGASGVVLEPTAGNDTSAIERALSTLQAGGSTNGAAGIQQAYQLAEQAFIEGGVNRVILATDGDFNVGMTDHDALITMIEQQREKGIALSTLGFGQGNYNDYLMEQLADSGNGNYAYIDNINEARKVLVDELQSNMQIIAKDVKVQVEFNPERVAEYRLIGYDNRALANEDFNNDKVDAGDIGAGHSVTALYEITLVDSKAKFIDGLRYQPNAVRANNSDELAEVKLRFKPADSDNSKLIRQVVTEQQITGFSEQSSDFQFALAVASFAQHIKSSKYAPEIDYQWIADTAVKAKGDDPFGYRSEFIQLVKSAGALGLATNKPSVKPTIEEAQFASLKASQ